MKKILSLFGLIAVAACGGYNSGEYYNTPTVDYVERLDLDTAEHSDTFLNQLAMNYRSYAIFNARQSGYPDMGEMFAQKAVVSFSGETPLPESMDDWKINDQSLGFELSRACQDLINMLRNDMSDYCPIEAAEAQAKFDCWLTASSTGQEFTANECRARFHTAMDLLRRGGPKGCGTKPYVQPKTIKPAEKTAAEPEIVYYPDPVGVVPAQMRAREGIIFVVNPEPVPPIVVNQTIYGGDKTVNSSRTKYNSRVHNNNNNNNDINSNNKSISSSENSWSNSSCPAKGNDAAPCKNAETCPAKESAPCKNAETCPAKEDAPCKNAETCPAKDNETAPCKAAEPILSDPIFADNTPAEYLPTEDIPAMPDETVETVNAADFIPAEPEYDDGVSRQEFIEMMQLMREEIRNINGRLGDNKPERSVLKVQQIPLEPKQHIMEEVFEVHFDFDKAVIKPEYEEVIKKLAKTTQENRNVKVSVVGHTDTTGSQDYNYALGGRRAKSVRDMLVAYGIPSDQIVIVSSGKDDLKVLTGDQVRNSENRRARVIKEQRYLEQPEKTHITALVEEQGYDVVEQ